MKDLGTYLKEAREKNGVSLLEAAEDLKIDSSALENIESGNVRAFKDMFILKELVKDYAKYLGLDANQVVEDFNDFLFEHTSKISLEEIKELNKKHELEMRDEKKVSSPYTKIPKIKRDYSILKKILIVLVILFILIFIIFKIVKRDKPIDKELKGCDNYEFTY